MEVFTNMSRCVLSGNVACNAMNNNIISKLGEMFWYNCYANIFCFKYFTNEVWSQTTQRCLHGINMLSCSVLLMFNSWYGEVDTIFKSIYQQFTQHENKMTVNLATWPAEWTRLNSIISACTDRDFRRKKYCKQQVHPCFVDHLRNYYHGYILYIIHGTFVSCLAPFIGLPIIEIMIRSTKLKKVGPWPITCGIIWVAHAARMSPCWTGRIYQVLCIHSRPCGDP